METLRILRDFSGEPTCVGLSDEEIKLFIEDPSLQKALSEAKAAFQLLTDDGETAALLKLPEKELVPKLQDGLLNFYLPETINFYVPIASRGPWIITSHGAVILDNGGYGMLGMGHNPEFLEKHLGSPQTMANVMTANFAQKRFLDALRREVGHTRSPAKTPYDRFCCLNSGSEAVGLACRITDRIVGVKTAQGGPQEGKTVKWLTMYKSFHGRTDRPALLSHSTRDRYAQAPLASHRGRNDCVVVEMNNLEALQNAFDAAKAENIFFEAVWMEPVQGEGQPGVGVTREFYQLARKLTREMGTLLCIDSIQAGLRCHGVLSVVDYPHLRDLEGPDMETWSKAINAGQYPLSVLGMQQHVADQYFPYIYGNTMTTNPRAMDVGAAVLEALTPAIRQNIATMGARFVDGFKSLLKEMPDKCEAVFGTGLLCCIEVNPGLPVVAENGLENQLRKLGIGVIHGGKNALRFTPHFGVTEAEVDFVVNKVREVIKRASLPK